MENKKELKQNAEAIVLEPTFVWHDAIRVTAKLNPNLTEEQMEHHDYQEILDNLELYITDNLQESPESIIENGTKTTEGIFVNLKRDTEYKVWAMGPTRCLHCCTYEKIIHTKKQVITPRDILENLTIEPGLITKIYDGTPDLEQAEIVLHPKVSFVFEQDTVPVVMDFSNYLNYVHINKEDVEKLDEPVLAIADFTKYLDDAGFADVLALFERLLEGTGLGLPEDNPRAIYHLYRALRERKSDFFHAQVSPVNHNEEKEYTGNI